MPQLSPVSTMMRSFKRSTVAFPRFARCMSSSNSSQNKNENRSALITGSTSGIGLTIANEFARQGYYVIITGFGDTDAALSEVRQTASLNGFDESRIEFIDADIGSRDDCINLAQKSAQFIANKNECKDGWINILINNAGIQHVNPITEFDIDMFDKMTRIMYMGPYYLMQQWMKLLRNCPDNDLYGRIINISSAHGKVASVNKSAYIGAKHGVIGFTKSCAVELAHNYQDYNVTSNAICPGFIETPLVKQQVIQRMEKSGNDYPTESYALVSEKHPTGKFVQPQDIASMVMYLCSNEAHQVTGTSMSIDGGWTIY